MGGCVRSKASPETSANHDASQANSRTASKSSLSFPRAKFPRERCLGREDLGQYGRSKVSL